MVRGNAGLEMSELFLMGWQAAPEVEGGAEYATLLNALLKRAPRARAGAKGSGTSSTLWVLSVWCSVFTDECSVFSVQCV